MAAPNIQIGAGHVLTGIKAISAPNDGSARSYLTLSTLATVLQSWDDHPHQRLTMPLQHGSLSLRWERWPVRQRCACDVSTRPGENISALLGFRRVGGGLVSRS